MHFCISMKYFEIWTEIYQQHVLVSFLFIPRKIFISCRLDSKFTTQTASRIWLLCALGQNQCHSTGVKKSFFPYLSFETKNSNGWMFVNNRQLKINMNIDCIKYIKQLSLRRKVGMLLVLDSRDLYRGAELWNTIQIIDGVRPRKHVHCDCLSDLPK